MAGWRERIAKRRLRQAVLDRTNFRLGMEPSGRRLA